MGNNGNKHAIITGASGALGAAMVQFLVGHHYHVLAFDMKASNLFAQNESVTSIQCDITDEVELEQKWLEFCQPLSHIELLINNAGLIHSEPLVSLCARGKTGRHSLTTWSKILDANLTTSFAIASYMAQHMILTRTKGLIINISSVCANGNAGQSAYSAAKAGVNALTKCWSKELAPMGIRCVAVAPGYVDTPSTHHAMEAHTIERKIKQTAINRLLMEEEIINMVHTVIENKAINGTILEIDGGVL